MEFKRNHIVNIAIAVLVASATILLSNTSFFKRLELLSQDILLHLKPHSDHIPKDIVIIEITDEEIKKIGRWPWERTWLTKMTNVLIDLKPAQILYDFIMTAKSDPQVDADLERAIARAGNVYLPSYWSRNKQGGRENVEPIPQFAGVAKDTGFINIVADIDGNYRRNPLYSKEEDGVYYSVEMKIVLDRLGLNVSSIKPDQMVLTGSEGKITIPMVEYNDMLLNWYGPWKDSFKRYSFLDILKAHEDIAQGRQPDIDVAQIKGSVCIVAVTAMGLYDIKPVPMEPYFPGAGIAATTIANILEQKFIHVVPKWLSMLFIYFVVLIPPFLILQERPAREILNAAGCFLVGVLVYVLFLNGIRLPLAAPLLAMLGAYVVVMSYNFASYNALAKIIEEKQKTNRMLLNKYKDLKKDLSLTEREKEELEKANRELDQFVYTVTHDIRAPLLGLMGYTDLLETSIKDTLNEDDKGLLSGIFRSIDRLNTLIDDMLMTTKISHGENSYEEANVEDLIRTVLQRLMFQIEQSKSQVIIQPKLPSINCDPTKMTEVFHNLISNAVKFSSKNNSSPKIEISYKDHGQEHEFCVKDNGIGINPKHQSIIFDARTRAVSSDEYEGTGLGLNIVKEIVNDHGGRVWVESSLGEGAAFYFTIQKDLN